MGLSGVRTGDFSLDGSFSLSRSLLPILGCSPELELLEDWQRISGGSHYMLHVAYIRTYSHAMYLACKYRQSSEELERVIYPKWGVSSVQFTCVIVNAVT